MGSDRTIATWSSDAWRGQAGTWLDEQLAAAGIERLGEVTQPRLRPWGTVLRATTSAGPVWLKAPGDETLFEVGLYRLLAALVPGQVLQPLAVDLGQGWLLLPDGGPTLAESLGTAQYGPALVEALVEILPQYAQLQRELSPAVDDLLRLGVADMRPAAMPQRFEEALQAVGQYVDQHGDQADRETFEQVRLLRGRFLGWCERLAQSGVPASIDHNDLHAKNIFSTGAGPARFYDWGDSVVAHPFASLLVALGTVSRQLGVGPDDPVLRRPRDAYLAVFGSPGRLVGELELACQIGKVARALTWQRALQGHSSEQSGDFAEGPLRTLAALRSDSWVELG